jgi:hypothetical protein
MIPNPTSDHWVRQTGERASWRVIRLMEVFQAKLEELVDVERLEYTDVTAIRKNWDKISQLDYRRGEIFNIHCREAIHDALDQTTDYLINLPQAELLNILVAHISTVVELLANPNSPLNTMIFGKKEETLLHYYFYQIRPVVVRKADSRVERPSVEERGRRNTIWISLIFRMLCWFLLHEFDQADIKIVPADLKDSRMPVYIG